MAEIAPSAFASHFEQSRAMVATAYAALLSWGTVTPASVGKKSFTLALIKRAGLSLYPRHSFTSGPPEAISGGYTVRVGKRIPVRIARAGNRGSAP